MSAASDAIDLPQMQLRPMRELDVGAVVAIERQVYPFPWTAGIFSDCLRVGYHCAVLEFDVITVGYGIVASGAGEAHLLNVCVREEFRNRGFGRALMKHLMGLAVRPVAPSCFSKYGRPIPVRSGFMRRWGSTRSAYDAAITRRPAGAKTRWSCAAPSTPRSHRT